MRTIPKESYLKAAQLFHWATREHYQLWFTGSLARHRRTEVMLPRLVRKGKLATQKLGKKIVYASLRMASRKPLFVEHGLGCTEGLVRMNIARMDGEVIPERYFRGLGSVPEWGIRYPTGKLLLYEFSTENNYEHSNTIKIKIAKYINHIPDIEKKFGGKAIVLFVIDISRERIENFIKRNLPIGYPFFFTDYETFKSVPLGKQLTTPIYYWGEDAKAYSLGSQNVGLETI